MLDDVLLEKLDIIISLQARIATSELDTNKEKILFLNEVGMNPTGIARAIGTTSNTVSVTISNAKKVTGKKSK